MPQAVVDKPTRADTVFTFQADDFVWSDPACKLEPTYSIKDIKVDDVSYVQPTPAELEAGATSMVLLDAATRSITYNTAKDQTITFNLKVVGRETKTGARATAEFLHTFEIRGCKGYNKITLGGVWPAENVHDATSDSWSYYRETRTLTQPNRLVKKELIPDFRYEDPACLFKSYSIA